MKIGASKKKYIEQKIRSTQKSKLNSLINPKLKASIKRKTSLNLFREIGIRNSINNVVLLKIFSYLCTLK